jgi:DNA-binding beta-propeller fold protein YncE
MKLKSLYRRVIVAFFCLNLVYTSYGQDSAAVTVEKSHPYISWVSQYPAHKEIAVKKNTAKRVYEFLVQKDKDKGLGRPVSIVGTSPGSFWVLDQGAETIVQVQKKKADIPRAIKKKENYFTSLVSMCPMENGDILFTDSRLNKVFLYGAEDKRLTILNDSMHFQQPTGIAYSKVANEIWVVETNAHRISILNKNGELIRRIGSRGDGEAQFNFPTSICIDKNGEAYVVDAMNFRVQIFDKDGKFVSMFGEAGDGTGSFARPKGIATDTYGNIYVADALFHAVQIFDKSGNFLYSFGKQGREQEEFWMPAGIYIDSKNYIYVADSYNSRIQIFQLINGS